MPPRKHSPTAITTVALLLAISSSASAFGYLDSFDGGTPISGMGVVSAAMGGACATYIHDPFAIFLNPAGLSAVDGFTASISGGVLGWKEIHRFGIERELRSDRIMGMRCASAAYPLSDRLVVAGGAAAVADADYTGARYLRNEMTEEVYGQEILYASGTQWDLVAGISAEPLDGLSLGISAGYRTGAVDLEYLRYNNWLGRYDSLSHDTLEVSEPVFRAGAMHGSTLTTLGVSYSAGGECLAPMLSGGFSVVAPHLMNVRVGLEGDLYSPLGRNDYAGRVQIQYPLDPMTGVLAGVAFKEQPSEMGSGMGLSLGATRLLGRLRLEAAMHWQTKKVFGGYIEGEDSDRVDDSTTEFIFGLTLLP